MGFRNSAACAAYHQAVWLHWVVTAVGFSYFLASLQPLPSGLSLILDLGVQR